MVVRYANGGNEPPLLWRARSCDVVSLHSPGMCRWGSQRKLHLKLLVATEVLDRAGVLPEADQEGEPGETDEETTERLAKIRDWVNELNLPDLGGDNPLSQS